MILLVITAAEPRTPAEALDAALLILRRRPAADAARDRRVAAATLRPRAQRARPRSAASSRRARAADRHAQAPPVTQALLDVESLLHGAHRARGEVMETFRVLAGIVERVRLELLALGDLDTSASTTPKRRRRSAACANTPRARSTRSPTRWIAAPARWRRRPRWKDSMPRSPRFRAHGRRDERRKAQRQARDRDRARRRPRAASFAPRCATPISPAAAAICALTRRGAPAARAAPAQRARDPARQPHAVVDRVPPRDALRRLPRDRRRRRARARIPHGYWIPMTTAIVLKPDFAGTFSFGLLRVIGTMLGLVLTTALVHYAFGSDWERLALLAVLVRRVSLADHRALRHRRDAADRPRRDPAVVLRHRARRTRCSRAASRPRSAARSRWSATCVWPTWESQRVPEAVAAMIDAYRVHLETCCRRRDRACAARSARAARARMRRHRSNACAANRAATRAARARRKRVRQREPVHPRRHGARSRARRRRRAAAARARARLRGARRRHLAAIAEPACASHRAGGRAPAQRRTALAADARRDASRRARATSPAPSRTRATASPTASTRCAHLLRQEDPRARAAAPSSPRPTAGSIR